MTINRLADLLAGAERGFAAQLRIAARTGTAISAAAVGVGARRSAA